MTNDKGLPWFWPRAAYVHIPFCQHHCGYCDFAVVAGQDQLINQYIEALGTEMSTLGEPQPVETIFLGGGTPTYPSARQLQRILDLILRWMPVANCSGPEFTVEANPGTLDADKIAVLADHGVTRISLGAQSFNRHLLRVLERDHDPDDVSRALELIRKKINQVSLDLIFGVPGQTLADWQSDMNRALDLAPDHISTYGLTYERGTRLWKQRQAGQIKAIDEETELAMYSLAIDTLEAAGFEHYEISNFACSGRRSRHNQVYWANEAYFGFGLGAARYVNGRRELNRRDLPGYLERAFAGQSVVLQSEDLLPRERARETMAVQLRRAEGINRPRFCEQTGMELDDIAGPAITKHAELGLLSNDGTDVYLTRKGKYVADAVIEGLL